VLIKRFALIAPAVSVSAWALMWSSPVPPRRIAPEELVWRTMPNGVATSVVIGNASDSGLYVQRVRFPSGFRIAPHRHSDDRVVTVISGSIHLGYGAQFVGTELKSLPTGSIWTEPAGQAHFGEVREGVVELQIVGRGPSSIETLYR
jgi:quercetin dioxygenase-like cupin family protein